MHPLPLRGRSEPVADVLAAIRGACRHGSSGLFVVSGPPGIGKTVFLREMRRQAARRDVTAVSAECDPMRQVSPGAPVIAMLRSGPGPLVGAEEYEQIVALGDRPLLLAERIAAVLENAATSPLLVCLDDWQWADRVSQFIVRTALGRLIGLPVVWLFAGRDDDALDKLLTSIEPGTAEHIRLAPLTPADLEAVAHDRLGRAPDERTRGFLAASAGNPLLAAQLLDDMARAAAPGQADLVPLRFGTAIAQRFADLTDGARALVGLLAVAGRPLTSRQAADVLADGPAPSQRALIEACARGLILAEGETLAPPHHLVREAVLAAMPAREVRTLHRRFAEYYLEPDGDLLAAAAHARLAVTSGDVAGALILTCAAERLAAVSPDDAGDLAALAFRTVRPDQEHWLEVGRRCLSVLCGTQRATEAIEVADLILAHTDEREVVGELETAAAQAMWLSGRLGALVARVERIITVDGALSHPVEARLHAARALAYSRLLPGRDAAREAAGALERARGSADPEAVAIALHACGEAARNEGRHQDALRSFRELRMLTGPRYLAEEITTLQFLDRYDHAQTLLDEVRSDAAAITGSVLPALHCAQIWQDFNLGRADDAETGARALLDLGAQLGSNLHVLDALIVQMCVALFRGDTQTAAGRLEVADRLVGVDSQVCRPGLSVVRGWLAASRGDLDTALEELGPVASGAAHASSYWPLWPCWMALFFEIGSAATDPGFTDTVVQVAELAAARNPGVPSFEGLALNLRGRVDDDLPMIDQAARVLARSPRPLLRAYGANCLGRALLANGERTAALHHLDRAWDDYHRVDARVYRDDVQRVMRDAGARRAKWATAVPRPDTGWSALTAAERRVAGLIAAGHTNKSAAAELGVSINTIGSHLRQVFSKLGIQSRVQLANALRAQGSATAESGLPDALPTSR